MPINVFGNNNSNDNNIKIDTSRFVQKSYLRSNYIETDIHHDINLKNQYKIMNLPEPTSDKDGVNKTNIDNKIADVIKRNIQNDDFVSFLDNDNNEYKLNRYHEDKLLTNETLFQLRKSENRTNTIWNYEVLDQNGSDLLSSVIVPRSSGMYSRDLIIREDDTDAFLLMFSGRMISDDAYVSLERRDIHNIKHIKLVYSRPNIDNTSGRFTISLLNNLNEWSEVLKFGNNQFLTEDYVWGVEEIDINFKNYGIVLKYNNVKSNKQDMAISRIILTSAVYKMPINTFGNSSNSSDNKIDK